MNEKELEQRIKRAVEEALEPLKKRIEEFQNERLIRVYVQIP
jgi:hypothetical protein